MEGNSAVTALLNSRASLISGPKLDEVHLEKIANANLTTSVDAKVIALGEALDKAFHKKSDVDTIRMLVSQGAPVNYRLDYGLEISLESHFVYEFFLLLEGDKGLDKLKQNVESVFTENPENYYAYICTAPDIYNALHASHANTISIPVNPNYVSALEKYVINGRANPYHNNGSLIIAAGLRDPLLVQKIITQAKTVSCDPKQNGGLVNFTGHFQDTAAVWSAILLDEKCLEILLHQGAEIENLGVLKVTLLHWVAVAIKMCNTPERFAKAQKITDLLIQRNIDLDAKNKLGITAIKYATGEFREFLEIRIAQKKRLISPSL